MAVTLKLPAVSVKCVEITLDHMNASAQILEHFSSETFVKVRNDRLQFL